MNQSDILDEILEKNRDIEIIQADINDLVKKNEELPEDEKDKDYTESIKSYYVHI